MTTSGVPAGDLSNEELLREMQSLHRTRDETLRHGPEDALDMHDQRTEELEAEYLLRFPEREITRGSERDVIAREQELDSAQRDYFSGTET
jgi:hypothetical protein